MQVNVYQKRKQLEQGLAESKGPGGRGGLSRAGWNPGTAWGAPNWGQRDIVCSSEEPAEVRWVAWPGAARLAEGVWAEFIQETCHFSASWGDEEPRWRFWGESLWELKAWKPFLGRKIQKPRWEIRTLAKGPCVGWGWGHG